MSDHPDWRIRPAEPADAEAVSAVFTEAGSKGWAYLGEARVRGIIGGGRQPADLVAEDDLGILGFIAWDAATGEITHVFVDPRAWGQGAGRTLLEGACDALRSAGCTEAWLHTEERNNAVAFYLAAGFTERGEPRIRDWHGDHLREPRFAHDL